MSCDTRGHNWDLWYPVSEQIRETSPWWYRRECQMLGCASEEFAQALAPVGEQKLIEADWFVPEGSTTPVRRLK